MISSTFCGGRLKVFKDDFKIAIEEFVGVSGAGTGDGPQTSIPGSMLSILVSKSYGSECARSDT